MEKLRRVIASTGALLAKLEKAPKAPKVEIDAVRMAFNEAVAIWHKAKGVPSSGKKKASSAYMQKRRI